MKPRPTAPRSKSADGAAFEALFHAEYPAVVRVAARVLMERAAAEDVAQEAFLAFHVRYPEGHPSAVGWLRLAAAHLALNRLRGERRRSVLEQRTRARGEIQDTPESIALASETKSEVRAALGRIKRPQATLLALRYSGLSYAEVAESLGIPVSQVGIRLRRAESALRKEVSHDQFDASR